MIFYSDPTLFQVEEYAKSEQDFVSTEDLGLSPEELQMLEMENESMYSELTALSSEVCF